MKKNDILTFAVIAAAASVAVISLLKMQITGQSGSGLGDEYKYDISEYTKTDREKILYEEYGPAILTGLKNTTAIALGPDDGIYVAGDNEIRKDGNAIIKTDSPVRCFAVAGDGTVYVGFKGHVEVFNAEGRQTGQWETLDQKATLTSIAVSEKDVFAADAGNRVVVHYDTAGNLINVIGEKDEKRNIPGFVIPSPYFDLAVADDGLLRVTNPGEHRIEAYTFDGDLEFYWGKPGINIEGFCGCCNPINFAIAPNGNFITCEKGLTRVKVYDPDGNFLGVVAGTEVLAESSKASPCQYPKDCQSGGFDVAVGKDGKVYILDTVANSVRTFVLKGSGNE